MTAILLPASAHALRMHCATDSAAGVAHVSARFRFRAPAHTRTLTTITDNKPHMNPDHHFERRPRSVAAC